MKIGYEAKRYFHNSSGLGNYARHLIRILAEQYPENEYLLYNPAQSKKSYTLPASAREIRPQLSNSFYRNLWRQRLVSDRAIQDGCEIFHGLSAELPAGLKKKRIKSVVTVHDLIFMRFPRLYKKVDRNIYKQKLKKACRTADLIVAISRQTKEDLQEYLQVPEERIEVIYPGIDPVYWKDHSANYQRVITHYNLPSRYVLFVGTMEPRKNPVLLARTCIKLGIPLVLVGRKTRYWTDFYQNLSLEEKQNIFTPRVEDNNDLATFYQLADLFVYPSSFEGFGLPVLEAEVSKTAVITSSRSSLPEAAGPESLLINPDKQSDLEVAVEELWENHKYREQIAEANYSYALDFKDELIAQLWQKTYSSLL